MPEISGNHLYIHETEDLHVEVTTGRYHKDCVAFPVGLCVKIEDWAIRGSNSVYGFLLLDCQNPQNQIGFFESVNGVVKTGIDVQMEKKDGTSLANFTFVNGIGEVQNEITMGTYVNNEFISLVTDGTIDVKNLKVDGKTLTTVISETIQSSGLSGIQGEKGDKGDKGDPGIQGPQGPAGTGSGTITEIPPGLSIFNFNGNPTTSGSSLYLVGGSGISVNTVGDTTTISATGGGGGGTLTAHASTHSFSGTDIVNAADLQYQSTSPYLPAINFRFGLLFDQALLLTRHLAPKLQPNGDYSTLLQIPMTGLYAGTRGNNLLSGSFISDQSYGCAAWISNPTNPTVVDYLASGFHIFSRGYEESTNQASCFSASREGTFQSSLVAIMGQGPGAFVNASTISDFGFYAAVAQTPGHVPVGFVSAVRGDNGSAVAPTYIALSTIIDGINYAIYCDYPTNVKIQLPSSPRGLPTGAFYRDGNGFVKSV